MAPLLGIAPRDYESAVPDAGIPESIVWVFSTEYVNGPPYDFVAVSGIRNGVLVTGRSGGRRAARRPRRSRIS
jgi:hypothetical protein